MQFIKQRFICVAVVAALVSLPMAVPAVEEEDTGDGKPQLNLTEEDKARINALQIDPYRASLVREFVSEIRNQAEQAGLEPKDFLEPQPGGEDDRQYRSYRLQKMKEKRDAERAKVEEWAKKHGLEGKPGDTARQKISRNEAMVKIAGTFESDPLKKGELYEKLSHTEKSGVINPKIKSDLVAIGKKYGIDTSNLTLLASNESLDYEADGEDEYTTVQDIFGNQNVRKHKAKPKAQSQAEIKRKEANLEKERRRQEKMRKALDVQQRKIERQHLREQRRLLREQQKAEKQAKRMKMKAEAEEAEKKREEPAKAKETVRVMVSPYELTPQGENATLEVKEVFRNPQDPGEIDHQEVWNPREELIDKELKRPQVTPPASNPVEKQSSLTSPTRSGRHRPLVLSVAGCFVRSAHATTVTRTPEDDMQLFEDQAEALSRLDPKKAREILKIEPQSPDRFLEEAASVVREFSARASLSAPESKPESSLKTFKVNEPAGKEENVRYLTTIFVSESMGENRIRELLEAYHRDPGVRFVVKGFNGKGTINDGLKWILGPALSMEPQPTVVIDPEAFRKYEISVVPAMLIEKVTGVPKNRKDALTGKVGAVLANLSTAMGMEKDSSLSMVERLMKRQNSQRIERTPALLVSGVTNKRWAIRELKEGKKEFNRGIQGEVFEIVERDIEEIAKERLANINWEEKKQLALDRFWTTQENRYSSLPLASANAERELDPTIVLTTDIYAEDGTVVLKKGARFNPFDAMPFTRTMIVFNGSQPKQVQAVEKLVAKEKEQNRRVLLIATEFASKPMEQIESINNNWKEPVYLLTPEIKERFDIRATPSVVRADNKRKVFKIEEIAVN